jgi:hypothetical protein
LSAEVANCWKEVIQASVRNHNAQGFLDEQKAGFRISPDGRLVGYIRNDAGGRSSTFIVVPIGGRAPRTVLSGGRLGFYWQWLPDSQGILVTKSTTPDGADAELWAVTLDGPARKVNVDMRQMEAGGLARCESDAYGSRLLSAYPRRPFAGSWIERESRVARGALVELGGELGAQAGRTRVPTHQMHFFTAVSASVGRDLAGGPVQLTSQRKGRYQKN